MIVVGIIGLLCALAIPHCLRYRVSSRRSVCIANLKQLQSAKIQWAFEKRKAWTDVPVETDLIGPSSYIRDKPSCSAGGADYFTTISQVDQAVGCTMGNVEGHTL